MLISVGTVVLRTVSWALAAYFVYLFAVVFCRLVSIVLYHRKVNSELVAQSVPQPCKPDWIAGHLIEVFIVNRYRRLEFWEEKFRESGTKMMSMTRACIDRNPVELITTDPAIVKYMLKDNVNNFIKTQSNGEELVWGFKEFLGDGIFAVSHGPNDMMDKGKTWHQQRKIISKMFTTNEFKNFIFGSFAEKADTLVEVLQKHEGPIDMQDMFFKYTMDSFGQIAFNASFNTMQGEPNDYGIAFDGAHFEFLSFIQTNSLMCAFVCLLPKKHAVRSAIEWVMAQTIGPLKRFKTHMAVLKKYTSRVIQDRRECPAGSTTAVDILGLFLKAAAEEDSKFDHQYLTDVVLNLILAGRDTTACLLSWTFYELCLNPDVMDTLRLELQNADPNDFKSMKSMSYLQAVLYEGGRLHPPVALDGKIVAKDDVLPDGTKIRAGCQLAYSPYLMGRDPDLWPDPEAFRPERWLDQGSFVQPDPYKYPVFQAGPRVCLGMTFAIMEASVCATKLIHNFDFELVATEQLMPDCEKLTMSIKAGLYLNVTPRTCSE